MYTFDPQILDQPGTVLVDDRDIEQHCGLTYIFTEPEGVLTAYSQNEIPALLKQIDMKLNAGKLAAGYISYDAGLMLDKAIDSEHKPSLPLAWFGIYNSYTTFNSETIVLGEEDAPDDISDIHLNVSEEEYLDCVQRIKDYIASGDVYQVNYTIKHQFTHCKPARCLFARLRRAHPVCHSAFINTGQMQVISLSPELFLRTTRRSVLTRPMKGTVKRGRWPREDAQKKLFLESDIKNRAENVMIVDLMRNDLGRVCKTGSIEVPRLFHVEQYNSLHQMTSDVRGDLLADIKFSDLIYATFPPGSVTGAPKIRAMEIIDETERESRGIYCGCIGFIKPGGDCLLNVAIRTIIQQGDQCEMGIGSGIVADSQPSAEYKESLLKSKFIKSESVDFQLLETLLYTKGNGYYLAEEHLSRMLKSAAYFGWNIPEENLQKNIEEAAAGIEADAIITPGESTRVRLLLSADGSCKTEWTKTDTLARGPVRLLLAPRRTDPADAFLFHKTTHRQAYDSDLQEARKLGYFDLIYLNTQGELTEGSITNIIMEIDGRWYTPPLACGLLPGIWRARLLEEEKVQEQVLTLDALRSANRVVVGNSVRGAVEVNTIECNDLEKQGRSKVLFRAITQSDKL